jgi:hypothetical protein
VSLLAMLDEHITLNLETAVDRFLSLPNPYEH